MKQILRIARYEYRRNVLKKSFFLMLISVPIFITISIGMGVFIESLEDNPLPVGYIDHAGVFDFALTAPEINSTWIAKSDENIEFIAYSSEEEAEEALKEGIIQVFNILPPDYIETRKMVHTYIEKPGENAERQFYNFLQINLLSSYPPDIAFRIAEGTDITVRSIDRSRVVSSGGPTFGLLMPLFITMAFLFMILMSSGYSMSAVTEEKENRTMEVLVTSISPSRLITGKILSIVAISLSLLFVWMFVILIGVLVGRQLGVGFLADLSMDWRTILTTFALAIPAYALTVALMTAIGAMVTTTQEGQSLSSVFIVLHMIPLYIGVSFLNNPHSSLAIALSLLPFSALMTVGMRNLFTIVPTWQILVSIGIQIMFALGAFWLAGRSLRLGLLRYGQRLTWRSLFGNST